MFKPLVALGISLALGACAGTTPSAQTASEECSLVDNRDATGSKISVRQECKKVGGHAVGAPQR
jgi:hypothetical protein